MSMLYRPFHLTVLIPTMMIYLHFDQYYCKVKDTGITYKKIIIINKDHED